MKSEDFGQAEVLSADTNGGWEAVSFRTMEDLRGVMMEGNYMEAAEDYGAIEEIFKLVSRDQELVMESNSAGELRLRGVLLCVVLELETGDGKEVLLHTSATATCRDGKPGTNRRSATASSNAEDIHSSVSVATTHFGGSFDLGHEGQTSETINDLRVITMLGKYAEPWASTLAHFFRHELNLSEAAISRVTESCCEDPDGTCSFECDPSPTLCYGHLKATRRHFPLGYTALRLRSRILVEDRTLFAGILRSRFSTTSEDVPLDGFGSLPNEGLLTGRMVRNWEWRRRVDALACEAHGMRVPGQSGTMRKRGRQQLCALLVGIENSAPLKEDVFGATHATDGKSKEISAFGKRKWRDYRKGGQEVPADLGGVRVTFNNNTFQKLVEVCEAARLSRPGDTDTLLYEDEQCLFKSLLVAPDEDISDILEDQLGITRMQAATSAYTIVRSINLAEPANPVDAQGASSSTSTGITAG